MYHASREPTLSDTSRWLGAPRETDEPDWWEGLVPDLTVPARVRMYSQLRYLADLGITINAEILRKVVDEAIEYAARTTNNGQPSVEPVTTVYYLRIGSLIKIGQTNNLERRLHAYPPGTVVLATETGPRDLLEAQRHSQFGSVRVSPQRREWFHPIAALIEHINSLREQPLTAADLAA